MTRESAYGDDELRLSNLDKVNQSWLALPNLVAIRLARFVRPAGLSRDAPDEVPKSDSYRRVVTGNTAGDDIIKKSPGLTHEWESYHVLGLPRSLADEEDVARQDSTDKANLSAGIATLLMAAAITPMSLMELEYGRLRLSGSYPHNVLPLLVLLNFSRQ